MNNAAAQKKHRESLSPEQKEQNLTNHAAEQKKYRESPNNNINKGRWTEEEHKIFMEEYEKYGINYMQIAKVLSTRTPAQIKKHAECFFKQI